MDWIVWLVAGGAVGVVACTVTSGALGRGAVWLNVVVGAAGALAGGSLLGPVIERASADPQLSGLMTFVASMAAAVVLLSVVRTLRRRAE